MACRLAAAVGAGEVGGRLVKVLKGLGWNVLVCDPPRQITEDGDYVSLQQVIEQCDVISLHTPLIKSGNGSTWHLFDRQRLAQLKPGTWLINASRGAVVDNAALREVLLAREDLQAVLDVWEGEPEVDVELAELCVLATPHIAGYSLDGKQRGTAQIYQAYCQAMGLRKLLHRRGLQLQAPAGRAVGLGQDQCNVKPGRKQALKGDARKFRGSGKNDFQGGSSLGRVTGRLGRAGCGTGAGFSGTDYPADARPASGAFFLELLEQLGLDAVALEWRQVFHEDLAQKVVHFMLDADRQHPVGLDRA